jgi:hypothetical protein
VGSYEQAFTEVGRINGLLSFEPEIGDVRRHLESGRLVTPHGLDRGLDPVELDSARGRIVSSPEG